MEVLCRFNRQMYSYTDILFAIDSDSSILGL